MRKLCLVLSIAAMAALVACGGVRGSSNSENITFVDPSTVVKGTMTDERNGQTYRTVKIGDQVWMAENLNYKTEDSYCYKDDEANCAKFGRLYIWKSAMSACPAGWHLPSKGEFEILLKSVGGVQDKEKAWQWNDAGKKLKSSSGWNENGNGDDVFGFSMFPAGVRYGNGDYAGDGNVEYFRSSTEDGDDCAYFMGLNYSFDEAILNYSTKGYGLSVRCLKD
jgi:uncharacterized protein (TIGR02145 family)